MKWSKKFFRKGLISENLDDFSSVFLRKGKEKMLHTSNTSLMLVVHSYYGENISLFPFHLREITGLFHEILEHSE